MSKVTIPTRSSDKKTFYFLIVWIILNVIQASFMDLNEDEAYYWLYSKFLDFGYFDHPPMVALFIKAGYALFHNTLGLRLISILASTISIFLLWQIVKEYSVKIALFIILFSSFLLFHVYGFISTPDSPLFFFSVLFFYCYQRYVRRYNFKWAFYLAIVVACLLYSKYHGILILLFTILSNLRLLKQPSFWFIVLLAFALYMPHIWWQIEHDLPSVGYHLFDRSAHPYQFAYTIEYIFGQILIAAPLVGWYFFITGVKVKSEDLFTRSLKFTFYGIFIFFLASTIKGRVEAHWTLIGFLPLFILIYIYLSRKNSIPKWLDRLMIANVILIVIMRLMIILPPPFIQELEIVKTYTGSNEWAKKIKEKAGENFVVFNKGFQDPSMYDFYNNTTKGFAYNSRYYRKTQFDIWPLEDSLRGKKVFFLQTDSHGADVVQDSFVTVKGIYYGRWIENVRLYQKVEIEMEKTSENWKPDEMRSVKIVIYNPDAEEINFSNDNQGWKCFFEYAYLHEGEITEVNSLNNFLQYTIISGKSSKASNITIKAPSNTGKYKLIFSLRTEPFPGTRNSKMITV
ncbi:MAG: ArnT family glycosyltransferase, partial [Chitinophagaceae bacterium]